MIQYGLVPAFSILVISNLWPEINYGFGLLLAVKLLRRTRYRRRCG